MNKQSIAFHRAHFLNVMRALGKIEATTMQVFCDEGEHQMSESEFLTFLMFNLQAEHREKTEASEKLVKEYSLSKFSDLEADPDEQVALSQSPSYDELMDEAQKLIKQAEAIKDAEVEGAATW